LQRTTRKVALTDAGQAYLERVRAILFDIEDAEAHAAASTRELRGSLHVLAPPVLATYFLAPLVAPWRALSAPAAGHCHRQLRGRPRGRV
jgi:DNA-binding transcriptional LysR family regulator